MIISKLMGKTMIKKIDMLNYFMIDDQCRLKKNDMFKAGIGRKYQF